jgi:hypothetical protein
MDNANKEMQKVACQTTLQGISIIKAEKQEDKVTELLEDSNNEAVHQKSVNESSEIISGLDTGSGFNSFYRKYNVNYSTQVYCRAAEDFSQ